MTGVSANGAAWQGASEGAGPWNGRGERWTRLRREDRGQTAIEFLGVWPFILMLLLMGWQCIAIGYAFSLAGDAADKAARSGAVHGPGACSAGGQVGGSWITSTSCEDVGGVVRATVRMKVPVLSPGLFNLPMTIEASAGARKETDD
ncbi:TadE/TadG family type IV pilus assembly protein [Streptomyces sp. NRRL S-87]|uniref:TadE/TadG family type IV pilus assembly protein n=1 Tax=Streptomyces sp. NRRL S-87 TaxID=1463920 RepID=UPI000A8B062C|nr:TadE family protein [Streptomyces sp. NRRL S-87]